MDADRGYAQRLAELDARIEQARLSPEIVCERAAGLLAGRSGCRIEDAHAHMRQLAAQQGSGLGAVAAAVIAALETQLPMPSAGPHTVTPRPPRSAPHPPSPERSPRPTPPVEASGAGWADVVQQMLDTLPGRHIVVIPERDGSGEIVDYRFVAVSPSVVDLAGRTGAQLVGERVSTIYPSIVGGPVWRAWSEVAGDGQARSVSAVPYLHRDSEYLLTVDVQPVGAGLLNTWTRQDEQSRLTERIAQTERLGLLGWGEWDLVADATVWSEGLYRIYERDPADGPMPREESDALGLPEDEEQRRQATEAFGRGETVDVTTRSRVNGKIKWLRAVVDAVRDADGRPVKIYGIIQDVTARETSRLKLAEVEKQLREHRQDLATEHRVATQLQQIVIPIPKAPIELPGLRVGVRYIPAEQAGRVGGDWYHAATTDEGNIILAVGDVAGHGLPAATTMAELRHALAALAATTTSDPARLLSHLNRLILGTATATAVVARYEPAGHTLTWAQAGHPAPLLARRGTAVELARPNGPLLGASRSAAYTSATRVLEPGDLLVMYTDGLIEHRSSSLSEGLARVTALLERVLAAAGPEPMDDFLAQLRRANPDDDTCVLVARHG
ncbi:PP2C family protein-serine/threonine phosphatase [Paractinoplanes atraurantiacus]|uniref:PAS domain S-box-containing protein n=1 Tax=Paractinoplanes atraurantiacus TaxID=1036182 RepID=A0A285JV98_9ACTN|nr:PP2C family protein-serine/threonine phosphatase [Actinoplanes atraurantiacus]SNY64235.1 PAS domain S-box-containing protein [Actinoplanes atraurantiacus]